jgi:hypothetical protein
MRDSYISRIGKKITVRGRGLVLKEVETDDRMGHKSGMVE